MLWYHEAPWDPNPLKALQKLQAHFFAEKYDLNKLLPNELSDAQQAIADAKSEGDPYQLLSIYQERLKLMEMLSRQPIPPDPDARIDILRQVMAHSGQGIGNILDLTGISHQRDIWTAHNLSEAEIIRLIGTPFPTREQAQNSIGKINEEIGRGESVCFPFYDEEKQPLGWFFVGNTVD